MKIFRMAAPLSGEYFRENPRTWAVSQGMNELYTCFWPKRAEREPLRALFDSIFLFSQMDEKGRTLAAELCQTESKKDVAWQLDIDQGTFLRLRAGRFIGVSPGGMQVGQMDLRRPTSKN